jgi:hypothetical protein
MASFGSKPPRYGALTSALAGFSGPASYAAARSAMPKSAHVRWGGGDEPVGVLRRQPVRALPRHPGDGRAADQSGAQADPVHGAGGGANPAGAAAASVGAASEHGGTDAAV